MESNQKPTSMQRVAEIFNSMKTPTEQNLAAALLMSLVRPPEKPKRKRKGKDA